MATKEELEKRAQSLETALSDAEGAIRRLGQQDNNLVEVVSKLSAEISALKVEIANLKVSVQKVALSTRPGASVSRYE